VLIVPSGAVQRGPNGAFAYVVTGDKEGDKDIEMRMLKTGPTEGDTTIIESGLNEGETVVTEGTDRLQPGVTKVTLKGQGKKKTKPDSGQPSDKKAAPADSKAAQTDATDESTSETTGYRGNAAPSSPANPAVKQQSSPQNGSRSKQKKPNGTKTEQ
jgi:multidrug efflux system membrane fusion protein